MTERETSIEEVIRVLVVEDEDTLRLSFPRVLVMRFDATLAATMNEALAHLNEPVAFHCVLSDFNLRDGLGRDGIWLLSEARVIQPWARRAACSLHGKRARRVRCPPRTRTLAWPTSQARDIDEAPKAST